MTVQLFHVSLFPFTLLFLPFPSALSLLLPLPHTSISPPLSSVLLKEFFASLEFFFANMDFFIPPNGNLACKKRWLSSTNKNNKLRLMTIILRNLLNSSLIAFPQHILVFFGFFSKANVKLSLRKILDPSGPLLSTSTAAAFNGAVCHPE